MKKFFGFIIVLVSLTAISEPKMDKEFIFYDIYPNTKTELEREMFKRTSIIDNGERFFGDTKWTINWRFKWKKIKGSCHIYKVNTDLKVQYTMPRIPNDFPVDSGIRNSFNKFYDALLKHEKGHKNSGLFAARKIEKQLLSIGAYKDCKKLEKIANQKGKSIIEKFNKRDIEYDKRTRHGRLEGVRIDNFI